MEHNAELIIDILKDEDTLNAMEKDITKSLIEVGRSASRPAEKANISCYANVVGDLELIGDYAKDILERVEIKISEKLLFSEEAVKEYEQLYKKTETALDEIVCALERDNLSIVKAVLKQEEHIDNLVDEIRRHDTLRLIEGTDSFMGRNMFLNILDFTAAVYYHAKKVARSLLKIKNE
jgi:phosphate:Na+ symporter